MFLSDLLPKFKKLRVLSLEGYYIAQLPNSIKDLRLLRCLNLTGSNIKSLPELTSSLINLKVLILRDCSCLTKLPPRMWKLINLRHLDLNGANSLKEMPLGMKELKNLQKLSNFIVGKDTGSSLKDLKNLKFLCGELCISGLENVKNSQDAREAALFGKQNAEVLSLQWGSQFDNSRDEVVEEHVFDMLQPHTDTKELTIKYYGGARFPIWKREPRFSQMEVLKLENCKSCTSLPSLGLLISLKDLTIKGMTGLKSIGSEFYGEGCLKPFQSLEILCFENLQEWEYWDTDAEENGLVIRFSSLRELSIVGCAKLVGKLPELLPSLEIFVVSKCAELVVSFSSFPMLSKLKIDGCKGLVCSTSIDSKTVKSMTISNSSLDIYGCKGMLYSSPTDSLSPLNSLTISNILEFGQLLQQGLEKLESLEIGDSLQIRWEHGIFRHDQAEQGLHVITQIDEVSIEQHCISLVSFPEVNFLPNKIRSLKIENCRALKFLPEEMMGHNAQLERLYIGNCDSLIFIARRKLPSSLKRLYMWSCKKLQCLVGGEDDASSSSSSTVMLKQLRIIDCPELTGLASGNQLLESLGYLQIFTCPKLESIPDGLHNFNCLRSIFIWKCPRLVSLPDDLHKLNSLRRLDISQYVTFPEEGFPTNLTSLEIEDDKLYKALIQWGFHKFTSLTELIVGGCHEAESSPDEEMGMMLPTSLIRLHLRTLSKLKCLSSMGFQSLSSLKNLWILDCPKLPSFPELGFPSSLMELCIRKCPSQKG